MKIRILTYAVCIFFIILLQSTVLDYIEIYNVKPNLIIIFVVSVALLRGNVEGAVIGFTSGLMQDMLSGKVLGFYSLLGLYLGLIIGSVNKRLYRENLFVILFFTFMSTAFYEFTVFILGSVLPSLLGPVRTQVEFIYPLRNVILPEAIYNSIVSIFIYIFVIKMNDRFDEVDKSARKY